MNSAIEHLNAWGAPFPSLAGTLLWQSTLLGLVILALDLGLRRRVRAAVRYALWLVLLVKLILPPSLALPTSPAWWWSRAVAPIPASTPQYQFTTVVNSPAELPPSETAFSPLPLAPLPPPPPPALTLAAWSLLAAGGGSLALLGWLILRWRQVVRTARAADEDPAYAPLLAEACQRTHCQSRVRVKITRATLSPAVCGLWRPVILLPQSLTETLAPEQLRAVLMHELMHVRRGDVWVNFAQALLQIIYWWHPLVWVANARIRRLREEAVDDAVMAALRDEADIYAPTLLAVAKFALQRPLASLGLVGILESRSALRQRIERLVIDPAPRRAGLSLAATFGLLVFSAVAVPMGDAPPLAPDNPANPSASTFTSNDQPDAPSNQVQQLVTFQLRPNSGLRKFRQQTGLTADSTADEYLAALSQRLAKAGIALPPERMLWLGDCGLLLVRGTAAELGAVDLLALDLNGFPTNNFHNPYSEVFAHGEAAPVETTNLFNRTFRLNTNTFYAAMQKIVGPVTTNDTQNVSQQLRTLFGRVGVNLQPPKAIFCNPRLRLIFVRATQDDLDTIESALETLNQPQPQIHIKARFLEVTGDPGAIPALTNYLDGQTRVSILAPGSARPWLHQLEQKPGSERLGEPEVTTLGGRQTEMRATQIQTVLTGINPKALTPPGLTGIEATNSAGLTNGTSLMCGTVVEFGPIFDVVPYVLADDHTVNLTVIAREDEFAGYDTPTNSVTVYVDGRPWKNRVPEVRPHFNLRELVTTQNLYDGQTLVLSQPVDPRTGQPVEHDGKNQKHLLVLATVSILDSAGNRIHPDETMPFTRDQVPPQPPKISSPAGPRKPFGSSPAFHLPEPPPSATGPDPVLDDRPFDKENQPLGF